MSGIRQLVAEPAIDLVDPLARHRLEQKVGQSPDQGIYSVWRMPRPTAVEIIVHLSAEVAHLVLKLWERAEMMDFSLLIESGDRFGAGDFAVRRVHRNEGEIRVDHPQGCLDHFTAVIDLGNDPIGFMCPIGGDSCLRPLDRWITA